MDICEQIFKSFLRKFPNLRLANGQHTPTYLEIFVVSFGSNVMKIAKWVFFSSCYTIYSTLSIAQETVVAAEFTTSPLYIEKELSTRQISGIDEVGRDDFDIGSHHELSVNRIPSEETIIRNENGVGEVVGDIVHAQKELEQYVDEGNDITLKIASLKVINSWNKDMYELEFVLKTYFHFIVSPFSNQ